MDSLHLGCCSSRNFAQELLCRHCSATLATSTWVLRYSFLPHGIVEIVVLISCSRPCLLRLENSKRQVKSIGHIHCWHEPGCVTTYTTRKNGAIALTIVYQRRAVMIALVSPFDIIVDHLLQKSLPPLQLQVAELATGNPSVGRALNGGVQGK